MSVTDRWNASSSSRLGLGRSQNIFELNPGQSCTVKVNGAPVITGHIDTVSRRHDANAHEITLSCRDKTGDLVDCSAIYKSGQWANKKIEQIATDLSAPFGITVKAAVDAGAAFPAFSIQLASDGLGRLLITRAGSVKAPAGLTESENILSADAEFSWKDRFSDYVVKGQAQGDDFNFAETVSEPVGSIKDAGITRYRPLIITAEDQGSNATLLQRAEWERTVRAGRGTRANICVQGWDVDGRLWTPNTLVYLNSPLLEANLELLIVAVGLALDDGGTITTLQLARPEAFSTIEGVKQTRLDKKIRKAQGVQVKLLNGETRNMERFQNYGFSSLPHAGEEVATVFAGGNRDHGLVVAVDDRRYRVKSLQDGEMAVYDDQGADIKLGRDGFSIEGGGRNTSIECAAQVNVSGGDVLVDGISLKNHIHGGVQLKRLSGWWKMAPPKRLKWLLYDTVDADYLARRMV